jgi:co-chaperonin GroES (HSP10)
MRSLNAFIIKPKNGEKYINTESIGGKEIVVNSSIEEAKDVQRIGIVVSVPELFKSEVKVGDEIIVWHNVFRMIYDNKGIMIESRFYIKDDLFYVDPELTYMVIRNGEKIAIHDNVFVEPSKIHDQWEGDKLHEQVGIIKYTNSTLKKEGIFNEDRIVFKKNCEHEFEIDGEKLYRMKNNRILAKLN